MGEVKNNPYTTLIGQLLGWLYQLPVIGFNWGKYDLNVNKDSDDDKDEYIDEDYDDDDETRFVIKRQNIFMCFSTKKLTTT